MAGLALLGGGEGRPAFTPGHAYEFFNSNLFVYFVLQMSLHIAYDGMLSYIWDGSTPGKRLLGLAVTGVGGRPLSLGSCLMRAVLKASFW